MLQKIKQLLGLEKIPVALPIVTEEKPAGKRSSQWARVRANHLLREPACRGCGFRVHLEVHHKIPFHVSPELELVEGNLITLCESPGRNCHYATGHAYSWKGWNEFVSEDADVFLRRVAESKRLANR